MIGSFKFADVNQMGSLNSLITTSHNNNSLTCNNLNKQNGFTTTVPSSQTAAHLTSSRTEPFNKSHFTKYGSKPEVNNVSAAITMDNVESVPSSRSCKGKRYQEFITSGKINPVTKKMRQLPSLTATPVSTTQTFPHNAYCKQPVDSSSDSVQMFNALKAAGEGAEQKMFDASDFNLECKILALPAHNLELYLSRKRSVKKRQKVSKSPAKKRDPLPQTIEEARSQIVEVGSRKRKARKESITRRDVGQTEPAQIFAFDDVENTTRQDDAVTNDTNGNDRNLLILATISELAANLVDNHMQL